MKYTIQQAMGNYSTDLETFDSREEAEEYLTELDLSELDLSYYAIEEVEAIEEEILDYFYKGVYTVGAEKMLEHGIYPNSLINWLLDQREELGEHYFDSIGLLAVVSIVESYNQARLNHLN